MSDFFHSLKTCNAYITKYRKRMLFYIVIKLFLMCVSFVAVLVMSRIISSINVGFVENAGFYIIGLAIIYLMMMALNAGSFFIREYLEKGVRVSLKKKLISCILLNPASKDKMESSKINEILFTDVDTVSDFLFQCVELLYYTICIVASFAIIFWINKILTIGLAFLLILRSCIIVKNIRKIKQDNKCLRDESDKHFKLMRDILIKSRFICFSKYAEFHLNRYNVNIEKIKDDTIKRDIEVWKLRAVNEALEKIWTIVVLLIGFYTLKTSSWSPFILILFYLYSREFTKNVISTINLVAAMQSAIVSLERVDDLGKRVGVFQNNEMPISNMSNVASLQIKEASFSYGDSNVLNDISFVSNKNLIAVVGNNGAGKSTLLKLMAGIEDVSSGTIVYSDGRGNNDSPFNIKKEISFLRQDDVLFDLTVRDNLLPYTNIDQSMISEMEEYCKKFAIYETIMSTPEGFDTMVSELRNWSGGQMKKLMLIRALVMKSQMLILDEPFAGLDKASKEALVEEIKSISKDKMVVVATHDDELFGLEKDIVKL